MYELYILSSEYIVLLQSRVQALLYAIPYGRDAKVNYNEWSLRVINPTLIHSVL